MLMGLGIGLLALSECLRNQDEPVARIRQAYNTSICAAPLHPHRFDPSHNQLTTSPDLRHTHALNELNLTTINLQSSRI